MGEGDIIATLDVCDEETRPMAMRAADLNADDKPDLAVTCAYEANLDGRLEVYLAAADGDYTLDKVYAPGDAPTDLNLGDINGDGAPDLIVMNEGQHERVIAIFANGGDGGFGEPVTHSRGGSQTSNPVLNDFNEDGAVDLVLTGSQRPMGVRNTGQSGAIGPFEDQVLDSGISQAESVLGDATGDGALDLVVPHFERGRVYVYPGGGEGRTELDIGKTFGAMDDFAAVTGAGDVDADGATDLIYTTRVDPYTRHMNALIQEDSGAWRSVGPAPDSVNPDSIMVGRFTQSDSPQVVAVSQADLDEDRFQARIYALREDALVQTGEIGFPHYPYSLAAADTDADGVNELFVRNLDDSTVSLIDPG